MVQFPVTKGLVLRQILREKQLAQLFADFRRYPWKS